MRTRPNLPGFNAAESLRASTRHYRSARTGSSWMPEGGFIPQQDELEYIDPYDTGNSTYGGDDSTAASSCMSGDMTKTCKCKSGCYATETSCKCIK
jgi:hypothetical protein